MSSPYTRTRSKDLPLESSPYTSFEIQSSSGRVTRRDKSYFDFYPYARTMDDVVTPNYEQLRKDGHIVMNPCSVVVNTHSQPGLVKSYYRHYRSELNESTGKYEHTPGEKYTRWTALHTGFYGSFDESDLTPLIASKLYSKASGNVAQILVSLGELRKTVQLIVGVKKRIARRLSELFYRKPGTMHRALNSTTSTWLEARYGWRPLLHDLDNLMEAYADQKSQFDKVYRSQYRYTRKKQQHDQPGSVWCDPALVDTVHRNTYEDEYSGVLLYKLNSGIINEYDRRFGLTALLSTAWELVPFSFLIDRVINIGDFLSDIDNHDLISTVDSCVTRVQTRKSRAYGSGVRYYRNKGGSPYKPTQYGYSSSGATVRKRVTIDRVTGVQMPSLPQYNLNLDTPLAMDILSLGVQLNNRKR